VFRCVKIAPDSSRAARATSTTSSTFLRPCSETPTFFPVVQNLQARDGEEDQYRQDVET
jgi:hypothetical protein